MISTQALAQSGKAFMVMLDQVKARQKPGVGPRIEVKQAQPFLDVAELRNIDTQEAVDAKHSDRRVSDPKN